MCMRMRMPWVRRDQADRRTRPETRLIFKIINERATWASHTLLPIMVTRQRQKVRRRE